MLVDGRMGGVEREDRLKGYCRYITSILLCSLCWSIKIEESCLSFRTRNGSFNFLEVMRVWYTVEPLSFGRKCYWCC